MQHYRSGRDGFPTKRVPRHAFTFRFKTGSGRIRLRGDHARTAGLISSVVFGHKMFSRAASRGRAGSRFELVYGEAAVLVHRDRSAAAHGARDVAFDLYLPPLAIPSGD